MACSPLQWVVIAYGLLLGGFLLPGGRLGDLLGRRRVLLAGLTLFSGASLLAGLAQSQGLLTDGPGWRWIFFINVPIGVVLIALAARFVPADHAAAGSRRFDALGAGVVTTGLLLVAGMALLALGLLWLTRVPPGAEYRTDLLPALLLVGIAIGLTGPSVQIGALSGVAGPAARQAAAFEGFQSAFTVTVVVAVVGALVAAVGFPRTTRIPALGPRGEGWVLIQAALLVGVVVAGQVGARWPENLQVPVLVIAVVAGGAGLWLAAAAIAALGRSGSPFPKPPATSELKQSGVYALVRHPIYGGVLLLSLAWSLARSPWALIPTGALALVLLLKSGLEERWLIDRHPAYAGYRQRVRRRLVPYLW